MTHKFSIGQNVYYEPTFGNAASRGKYKIVRPLPVENDNRLAYRIKSIAEILRAHRRGTPAQPHRLSSRAAHGARQPPNSRHFRGQNSAFHRCFNDP